MSVEPFAIIVLNTVRIVLRSAPSIMVAVNTVPIFVRTVAPARTVARSAHTARTIVVTVRTFVLPVTIAHIVPAFVQNVRPSARTVVTSAVTAVSVDYVVTMRPELRAVNIIFVSIIQNSNSILRMFIPQSRILTQVNRVAAAAKAINLTRTNRAVAETTLTRITQVAKATTLIQITRVAKATTRTRITLAVTTKALLQPQISRVATTRI